MIFTNSFHNNMIIISRSYIAHVSTKQGTQGLQACLLHFERGKGTKACSPFGKGHHPMRILYISTRAFKGHQGNDQGALRQSPSLPPLPP